MKKATVPLALLGLGLIFVGVMNFLPREAQAAVTDALIPPPASDQEPRRG